MSAFKNLSLTARLSLFFTTLSCVVLLALGWVIAAAIEQHFKEQDEHALSGKLELAQHIIERVNSEQDVQQLSAQLGDALVGHHDLVIHILDHQGKVLLNSNGVTFPAPHLQSAKKSTQPRLFAWQDHSGSYRGLIAVYATKNPQFAPITVAIAIDIAHHLDFMRTFQRTLWLFVFVAALLTAIIAWFAASRGLRPLSAMRDRAASVTANKLDQRLSIEAFPPELADLAHSLNQMLARLEEAFQRLSDFSSDLAHELRTPISNLMTQTQVSLSKARDAASYRDVLESNAEEYGRLARMIADMLFLAKAENGLNPVHQEDVDLVRELRDLFEFYDALAEERQLRLVLTCDQTTSADQNNSAIYQLRGDRLMLRRALSNVLSNALRHTPAGEAITVKLSQEEAAIRIQICNPGPGIAPEHLPRLFERFYRADHARQHIDGEGSGLGLAIVQAIIRSHHGSITVSSDHGLTCFSLWLPRL